MPKRKGKCGAKPAKKTGKTPFESDSDVLGSYTGTPKDGEMPIQDADDL